MPMLMICGSRGITEFKHLAEALVKCKFKYDEIVSGGAKGVDKLAEQYADRCNVPITVVKPEWDKHHRGAGIVRNRKMVTMSDCVLAVWDGKSKGTQHSINFAQRQGKPVYIHYVRD